MLTNLLVTGEGPTDMGVSNNQQNICTGDNYNIGAMAIVAIRVLQHYLPDWNSDNLNFDDPKGWITYIGGNRLAELAKNKQIFKPSKKLAKGFIEHAHRAVAMAEYAYEHTHQLGIYFHDADKGSISHFINAITLGANSFDNEADYPPIVAMIPKPTSEAWFICAKKESPYTHCAQLEHDLSGNDSASPQNSPKRVLASLLGVDDCTTPIQLDLAKECNIEQIDMPSFNKFKADLHQAITKICGTTRVPL